MEYIVQLNQLAAIENVATRFSRMGNNYLFARIKDCAANIRTVDSPVRLECMSIVLCRRGSFCAEINFESHRVEPHTILVVQPNTLLKFSDVSDEQVDAYVLFVSVDFLKDINIDLNAINIRSLIEKRSPALLINDLEERKLIHLFEVLELNGTGSVETVFTVNLARSICAAIFYQLLQCNFMRINSDVDTDEGKISRRSTYVRDFLRLVHLHYTRERSLSFYAERLFISPKYLTVLVKDATGRSASDWISEFVIMEAKNLLRFSGKNVQQVAYALNFPNQSSFGKYFKHLTGQSPTAYQKS